MIVVGLDDDAVVFETPLEHGQDPEVVAYGRGFNTIRPLDAVLGDSGDLVLRLSVQPSQGRPGPATRARGRDRGLKIPTGIVPEIRQRFAAYAVVSSQLGLLATQYSARTAVEGRWGMPGGGIDDGEQPVDAVLREVAEETSQQIVLGELIRVQTSHWVGRSPRDTIEDFHAVRMIYRATCTAPSEPVVADEGGTTESARWVPLPAWTSLAWTQNWRLVLGELLVA